MERFVGILIEHFAGAFPLWLAPTQLVLAGITDNQNDHIRSLERRFLDEGFRIETDLRSEKVNLKVREHSLQKVPLIGVFGDREVENGTVSIRRLGSKKSEVMTVDELIKRMHHEIETRALPPGFKRASEAGQ